MIDGVWWFRKTRRDVAKIKIFWKSFHNEKSKWSEITQVSFLDSCNLNEKERVPCETKNESR